MEAPTRSEPFVIAVDAGGTYTRVGCFGVDGSLLSSAVGHGGSPDHNHDAARNVAATLARAIQTGGLDAAEAVGLAAGMAAISRVGSNQGNGSNGWAEEYFAMPALTCPRMIVNDAVAAHRGALLGEAGVIVVAGTGSMILAITDEGMEVESGQFEHYAGGARHLVFDAMQLILSGAATTADEELVAEILKYWKAESVPELRRVILGLASTDRNEVKHRYGRLAPRVTAAADTSPLADRALRRLARRTARGVAVLAPLIETAPVSVVAAGALATDARFVARLVDALADQPGTPTRLIRSALDPLRGAALLAYERAGIPISQTLIEQLRATLSPSDADS